MRFLAKDGEMANSKDKRFLRQLYPEIDIAVNDFLNNSDHRLHPYLYDDISDLLSPDKNNGKYLDIKTWHFFFDGRKKISERIKFDIPISIIIITNIGMLIVKSDAKALRKSPSQIQITIEDYEIESLVPRP